MQAPVSQRIRNASVDWVQPIHNEYPLGLKRLPSPVPIFLRGSWQVHPNQAIAMVGTRKPTRLGVALTQEFVARCASQGWSIVSGLAKGIDGVAHEAALKWGCCTAAVLGCGVDVVYPRGHANLANRVANSGALISEYPLGTQPLRGHFPKRNRLIAALSRAIVVVEAGLGSGALHTAVYARRMGIPVLVPRALIRFENGAITPEGLGLQLLLEHGAFGFDSIEEATQIILKMPMESQHLPGVKKVSRNEQMHLWKGNVTEPNPIQAVSVEMPERWIRLLSQPGGARLDELQQNWASDIAASSNEVLAGACQRRLLDWELKRFIVRQPDGNYRLR